MHILGLYLYIFPTWKLKDTGVDWNRSNEEAALNLHSSQQMQNCFRYLHVYLQQSLCYEIKSEKAHINVKTLKCFQNPTSSFKMAYMTIDAVWIHVN